MNNYNKIHEKPLYSILLYKHQEMTKFENFRTIKGMTATKKIQKAFGGPPKYFY